MSVVLDCIKDNFGVGVEFLPWDIHIITKIEFKVVQMILKKFHNNHTLACYYNGGSYVLLSDETINRRRKLDNELIDKYNLKNKKFKLK